MNPLELLLLGGGALVGGVMIKGAYDYVKAESNKEHESNNAAPRPSNKPQQRPKRTGPRIISNSTKPVRATQTAQYTQPQSNKIPKYREVGKAGAAIGNSTAFSKTNAQLGAEGEREVAKLFRKAFNNVPGYITMLHGVQFPGSSNADVDHVLVIGRHVFPIDAKLYRAGMYELSRDGGAIIGTYPNGGGRTMRNSMGVAGRKFQELLGSGIVIRKAYIIVTGRTGETRVRRGESNGVMLGSFTEVYADIMYSLRPEDFRVDNTKTVNRLRRMLKK